MEHALLRVGARTSDIVSDAGVTHETRRLVEWLRAGLARAAGRRYRINLDEFEVVSEWSHGVGSDQLEGSLTRLRVRPSDPKVPAQAHQAPVSYATMSTSSDVASVRTASPTYLCFISRCSISRRMVASSACV